MPTRASRVLSFDAAAGPDLASVKAVLVQEVAVGQMVLVKPGEQVGWGGSLGGVGGGGGGERGAEPCPRTGAQDSERQREASLEAQS